MTQAKHKKILASGSSRGWCVLFVAMLVVAAIYTTGLSGAYLFDDYPNIVDNHAVQPTSASLSSLVGAALSSSSSEFKRPLASLSFAANFLISGLDPYWMKLTNLIIHLLNGLLVFLLARSLISLASANTSSLRANASSMSDEELLHKGSATAAEGSFLRTNIRTGIVAAFTAASWMLLPINLTGVLYVVQRMESMANVFVLVGLIGYVAGRRQMLDSSTRKKQQMHSIVRHALFERYFMLCLASITVPTVLGILAKETAVMLPLYALLVEWAIFRFATIGRASLYVSGKALDGRMIGMFLLILVLPMVVGLSWLLPGLFQPINWATRDFTLGTRLLSEARIVVDYIVWTLLPTPNALSFYHDNFRISTGLFAPISTVISIAVLAALFALMLRIRRHRPLVSLGLALFFGCHLLTGTVIPLELVYEHRNYFASFGLLLALVPLLAAPAKRVQELVSEEISVKNESPCVAIVQSHSMLSAVESADGISQVSALPMAMPRHVLLAGLMICWAALTAITSYAWGNPLRLAEDLAARAPLSPRAQYELGRTYIIYSHYDPGSPFTKLAYVALEKAAALPESSILPEQALIFMNARMNLPVKNAWWDSLITKLKAHKPGVQDESSLGALTQCDREQHCDLVKARMTEAYLAALSHPNPSARLLAMYGDYAWNLLGDHDLGLRMTQDAVKASPNEPAYLTTLVRMLSAQGRTVEALGALDRLQALNIGGRLNNTLTELHNLPGLQ
jgi:hypothetical protein